jgi:hypothetical protein
MKIKQGDCVKIPDGRYGRVRDYSNGKWRVRVKRKTSNSHQFMYYKSSQLRVVSCPKGWMSIKGYNSYVRKTLSKMKRRR